MALHHAQLTRPQSLLVARSTAAFQDALVFAKGRECASDSITKSKFRHVTPTDVGVAVRLSTPVSGRFAQNVSPAILNRHCFELGLKVGLDDFAMMDDSNAGYLWVSDLESAHFSRRWGQASTTALPAVRPLARKAKGTVISQ